MDHSPPARRVRGLLLAVAVKVYLIGWVNPTARDATASATATRDNAILWAVPNGVAILAVATALILLVSWRMKAVDQLSRAHRLAAHSAGRSRRWRVDRCGPCRVVVLESARIDG